MKKRKIAALATLIATGAITTGCVDPFSSAVCVYGAPLETDPLISESETPTTTSFSAENNDPEVVYGPPVSQTTDISSTFATEENIPVDVYGPPEYFESISGNSEESSLDSYEFFNPELNTAVNVYGPPEYFDKNS